MEKKVIWPCIRFVTFGPKSNDPAKLDLMSDSLIFSGLCLSMWISVLNEETVPRMAMIT